MADRTDTVLCVDFGSTFTKAVLVDLAAGRLLGTAQHPTTLTTDVFDGLDRCLDALAAEHPQVRDVEVLACSSAGGGLRIGVVGNEELVTAEAGRRVALSSGGRVVTVLSGGLDQARLRELRAAEPDVVLLVGGTDGGNAEQLLADAGFLGRARWRRPVVLAGAQHAAREAAARLEAGRTPYVVADNVVPRIGVLAPDSARAAIREAFLAHVIGGKHLSRRADFASMLLGPTPDIVLAGVEELARHLGDTVVVDVGGATTDVHSVVTLDPETAGLGRDGLARDVVAPTPVTRTVEGDLGMRWSAVSTIEAAVEVGLLVPDTGLVAAAQRRTAEPGLLPEDQEERWYDETIATAAAVLALRRHAGRSRVVLGPDGRVVERTGKDLREVDALVGSGGVLRAAPVEVAERVLRAGVGVQPEGWQLPERPAVLVDRVYLLAALGLVGLARPARADRLGRVVAASLSGWRGEQ